MRTRIKRWLIPAAVGLAVLVVLLVIRNSKPYGLSVTFVGWTNIQRFTEGDCALLAITNNGSSEMRFDTLAVEYQTKNDWHRVVPTNWPWFQGLAWRPRGGTVIPVPRPAEVPSSSPWRIRFVYYRDVETDTGPGTQTNHPRTRLNRLAKTILRKDTLLFYSPVKSVTPEIPPVPNEAFQRTGTNRFAQETNSASSAVGSRR